MAYDPNAYAREQLQKSDTLFNNASNIAATFSKLDGNTWKVEGNRTNDDNGPEFRLKLIRENDGMAIALYINHEGTRVSCAPSVPMMPGLHSSGYASLRNFLPYSLKNVDSCEAAVAADRYTNKPEAVARDFYKRTVTPYNAYFPQILAYIEERKAGWQQTRDVADGLAKDHGGKISVHDRGESISVYFTSSLPTLEVRYGGHVRIEHALSLDAATAGRVLTAIKG
jgi:hypothetical protein